MTGTKRNGHLDSGFRHDGLFDGGRVGVLAIDKHNNVSLSSHELPLGQPCSGVVSRQIIRVRTEEVFRSIGAVRVIRHLEAIKSGK